MPPHGGDAWKVSTTVNGKTYGTMSSPGLLLVHYIRDASSPVRTSMRYQPGGACTIIMDGAAVCRHDPGGPGGRR